VLLPENGDVGEVCATGFRMVGGSGARSAEVYGGMREPVEPTTNPAILVMLDEICANPSAFAHGALLGVCFKARHEIVRLTSQRERLLRRLRAAGLSTPLPEIQSGDEQRDCHPEAKTIKSVKVTG
jgi:hypothetical protein